ncbi:uncharacterized protein LOC131240743 isoform X2 [Magnolia sinica]|uniref:uncharacterized protein LOC131240743 isoform X2 n=1 Tax=Magnolia sinica TaxID=86752 RepID=UPI00265AEA55|nr:uncharacterized protein LOC131240743 isoform X2 [Magnolia sinica]
MTVVVDSIKFRARDYGAEQAAYSLPRVPTENHPLAAHRSSHQVDSAYHEKGDFYDPLRGPPGNLVSDQNVQNTHETTIRESPNEANQLSSKGWAAFRRSLMQKFSLAQTVSISSMSDVIIKGGKEKSLTSLHLEELEYPQRIAKEEVKVVTRQEYISRLHELKDEISRAWQAEDRVASLRLSIKVARLLMDTSVLQFYPTLFILVTDVMDMLGDMVWERIKRRAEFSDNGTLICCLPENFKASDVSIDAKETCNNWFCKIGSIRELLPRIYLELAILRCYRFLYDGYTDTLQRLTMMIRGVADPIASAYCRLYLAHCALRLPPCDIGFLIISIKDITTLLTRIITGNQSSHGNSSENRKLLIALLEPTIEWITKCIFKHTFQWKVNDILVELGLWTNLSKMTGNVPFISIVLYHLLKELPDEVVYSNALEIVHLIECSKDISIDQYLNYRLLGLKLCESKAQLDSVSAILDKVFQVFTRYDDLNEYLKVADAYLDIVLQLQMNHFVEILDIMHGISRNIVNMHILTKATRNGCIRDPVTIQLLFEISRALHDSIDFRSMKDDVHQQSAHLISRFVQMVDFGDDLESHLTFLVECRTAFGSINELKETLVHSSNYLAIKAVKDASKILGFVRSCIAFNEVTIPSISAPIARLNLFLETAEAALLGGLVSHTHGVIDSAISTLQSLELADGSRSTIDAGGVLSLTRKICSFLVMVPGNPEEGIAYIPRNILSLVNSQSWMTPASRIKTFCAIVSLSATLSQNKLPYCACNREVVSNDQLFFGEPSYSQELVSISSFALQNVVDGIQQESSTAARGNMALEACNCIISSFEASDEMSLICKKLIEIAKSCLHANDKYLRSTVNLVDKQISALTKDVAAAFVQDTPHSGFQGLK